ncbi:MAG: hypothetical protein DRP71_11945 [Verrucomicrobia bacterium]|nr:MAG: hypothetical protein DRP71_11945 [Verrucomicrobiota bacterium]
MTMRTSHTTRPNPARLAVTILALTALAQTLDAIPPKLKLSGPMIAEYVGTEDTDRNVYHGGLRHAVGVHRIQAMRANRTHPPETAGEFVGWTYNHAPMLAYWQGRFWVEYVSNLKEEHGIPGRTAYLSSSDGFNWTQPAVAFPVFPLPEIQPPPRYYKDEVLDPVPAGTAPIMHQRMGWYVAPDGRLLMLGFYGYSPTPRWGPNRGQGLGRVVREVHPDGSAGAIHVIRANREAGWTESDLPFPFYKTNPDAGFVAACDALLADRLMTLQWWEEDRATDGFFPELPEGIEPKALSFYQRADGKVVGLWKGGFAGLTSDRGQSWEWGRHNLPEINAKVWGQRLSDNTYALVYDHSASGRSRYPLSVVTGTDGERFDHLLAVHPEVPPMRYQGVHKNHGPQYIRGIAPGNGTPSDGELWLTYSVNKEDIWVARVRVPISDRVDEWVDATFDRVATISDLRAWNLYLPKWAPVSVVEDPRDPTNRCLELIDDEPWDYAKVERPFPEAAQVRIAFRAYIAQVGHGTLEIEAHGARSERPMRLRLDKDWLMFDHKTIESGPTPIGMQRWYSIELSLDSEAGVYSCTVDGKLVHEAVEFAEPVEALQRLVFRTGPWRMDVRSILRDGYPGNPGLDQEDLAGADIRQTRSRYLIDDLVITPL